MNHSNHDGSNIPTSGRYQKQKLYIEELEVDEELETFERDLKTFLSKYGTVIDMKILTNQSKKHYAFVTYQDDDSVELLLAMQVKFKGCVLKISRARKPKVKKTTESYVDGATKVFVGAIPSNVTLEEFKEYFEQFGPVEDICLPLKNKTKAVNRGHGFVTYVYPKSAEVVIKQYKHHYLRAKWIDVRIAKPRNSTSPNFKAFSSAQTTLTDNLKSSDRVSSFRSSKQDTNSEYRDLLSPLLTHVNKKAMNPGLSYFSLSNTFYGQTEKNSYTERLNTFVQRFSQDLVLNSNQKFELLNFKKRLSENPSNALALRSRDNANTTLTEGNRPSHQRFEGDEEHLSDSHGD